MGLKNKAKKPAGWSSWDVQSCSIWVSWRQSRTRRERRTINTFLIGPSDDSAKMIPTRWMTYWRLSWWQRQKWNETLNKSCICNGSSQRGINQFIDPLLFVSSPPFYGTSLHHDNSVNSEPFLPQFLACCVVNFLVLLCNDHTFVNTLSVLALSFSYANNKLLLLVPNNLLRIQGRITKLQNGSVVLRKLNGCNWPNKINVMFRSPRNKFWMKTTDKKCPKACFHIMQPEWWRGKKIFWNFLFCWHPCARLFVIFWKSTWTMIA